MNIKYLFNFVLIIFLLSSVSCHFLKKEKDSKTIKENVAENGEYIDVDPETSQLSNEDKRKLIIVLSRLYKHIEIIDNHCFLRISKGSEINISERLFSFYQKSFETMNRDIDKLMKENPDTIILVPPLMKY